MANVDQIKEQEWIKAAKLNPRDFELLYNAYYVSVFKYVYRKIQDKSITADIVSEVFLKAMVNIQSFEYKGISIEAWFIRIAMNEMNLFFRKTGKVKYLTIEEHIVGDSSDEPFLATENLEIIANLMSSLSEEEALLVELRIFDMKSFKEIGDIFSITENNAKVKFYRIIDKLKKNYQEKYHGE